jgi:hypothetical protein
MAGTSMPCADSSTICARRQVTTEPELRRTIRSSRSPSWAVISRTRTRWATPASFDDLDAAGSLAPKRRRTGDQLFQPNEANDAGEGTVEVAGVGGVSASRQLGELARGQRHHDHGGAGNPR